MTPSPFVVQWVPALAERTAHRRAALDVAMGLGRHLEVLDRAGYAVFGVDASFDRVMQANAHAVSANLVARTWCADLTMYPLPERRFDLVLVTRYLQRDLFASLGTSLRPGGVVIYETFTRRQLEHGRGPTSPDHLLEPGELRTRFPSFDVLFYEEVDEPEGLARLVARRPIADRS